MLVYRGSLQPSPSLQQIQDKAPTKNRSKASKEEDSAGLQWGNINKLDLSQSILFTNDPSVMMREVSLTFFTLKFKDFI